MMRKFRISAGFAAMLLAAVATPLPAMADGYELSLTPASAQATVQNAAIVFTATLTRGHVDAPVAEGREQTEFVGDRPTGAEGAIGHEVDRAGDRVEADALQRRVDVAALHLLA